MTYGDASNQSYAIKIGQDASEKWYNPKWQNVVIQPTDRHIIWKHGYHYTMGISVKPVCTGPAPLYGPIRTVVYPTVSAAWWRHQMETFSALLALSVGNSPVNGEFPAQRPVTRSFDVFFDLRLNKRLSKQPWGWWFETPSWSLWRHCNGDVITFPCSRYLFLAHKSSYISVTSWIYIWHGWD